MRNLWAIVLLGLLAACSGDKDNSEPPAVLTNIEKAIALKINWTVDTRASSNQAAYRLQPLISGDRVYTIDTSGQVRAIELVNGGKSWRYQSGFEPITGIGGTSQMLIVASRDGDIAAYREIEDGLEPLWNTNLGSEIRATPVIADDQVIVRSVDGRLHSLSATDGSQQWQVTGRVPALSLTGNSNPLVAGEMVIAGFDDGKLIAYNRDNGKTLWETTISLPSGRTEVERLIDLDGRFVLRDGVIYVVSFQGHLAAVQALSGDILWSRKFSSFQAIAIDDTALYLSSDDSDLWSIDRRTGSAFWKQDVLHARRITAPSIIGDKLVVADYQGYLHWLNKSDGKLLGRIRTTSERNYVQPQVWGESVITLDLRGFLVSVSQRQ
ncbi:MAG TPA: outer membrane protein assembly factor BamB [Gammaproteobacteria bacterium]|nr:outer membrane protein assembly factor BamB [Gammaproteobacteria bacterium]